MAVPLYIDLASRHLRYSLVRGIYYLPLLSVCLTLYLGWEGHWPRNLEIDWLTPLAFIFFALFVGTLGTAIGIVILGIPAAFHGLLRLLPMRGLFRLSVGRPAALAYTLMLAGTLILFEASVLLAAKLWLKWLLFMPPPPYAQAAPVTLYDTWLKVSILSSPWLLSSLHTSWKLIRPVVGRAASAR